MTEQPPSTIERTLVLVKPDGVARGLVGSIIARFESALLKVVAVRMRTMDADFTRQHYADLEERLGSDVYRLTAEFMQSGPVVALALEGVDAVRKVRAMIGSTYPDAAAPGTIRGDLAHQTKNWAQSHGSPVANLVHASGSPDEAKTEVALWFANDEQFDYVGLAERFTY